MNVSKAFKDTKNNCHKGKMDLNSDGIDFKVSLVLTILVSMDSLGLSCS